MSLELLNCSPSRTTGPTTAVTRKIMAQDGPSTRLLLPWRRCIASRYHKHATGYLAEIILSAIVDSLKQP